MYFVLVRSHYTVLCSGIWQTVVLCWILNVSHRCKQRYSMPFDPSAAQQNCPNTCSPSHIIPAQVSMMHSCKTCSESLCKSPGGQERQQQRQRRPCLLAGPVLRIKGRVKDPLEACRPPSLPCRASRSPGRPGLRQILLQGRPGAQNEAMSRALLQLQLRVPPSHEKWMLHMSHAEP